MKNEQEIRQQLIELIYDLLPEDEKLALLDRISSDPEVARAYSEARLESDAMAKAAKLEAPQVKLELPAGAKSEPAHLAKKSDSRMPSLVALAAGLLVAVTLGGYLWHRAAEQDIASQHLRLLVTGPARLQAGIENQFSYATQTVTGQRVNADVEVALFTPDGRDLLEGVQPLSVVKATGERQIILPADLKLPDQVRLEVRAFQGDSRPKISMPLAVQQDRFVTHLSNDKPWYKPGETVYFRSLTLSRFAMTGTRDAPIQFEVLDPSGAPVAGSQSHGVTHRGVGNGAFAIPSEVAGGEYTLVARSLDESFPEETKTFLVRRYRLPRLKKELEFTRDSYAPGDEVIADFAAERAEGGAAADAALQIIATVDGETVFEQSTTTSAAGTAQIRFTLPSEIEHGDAQLAVIVDDGSNRETSAKTLPINLGKVDIAFYPEGGDLVSGVENAVYFSARDPKGDPVEIEAELIDDRDQLVEASKIVTVKEGLGRFTFQPSLGKNYRLRILSPAGVQNTPELPATSTEALVALTTQGQIFAANRSLTTRITSNTEEPLPLVIAVHCRGVLVGNSTVTLSPGQQRDLSIAIAPEAEGVLRLTLLDYRQGTPRPLAERLVYRKPQRKLNVAIADASSRYSPGDSVQLNLQVTDENGQPVPAAALGVAIVDDALLAMAREGTLHQAATMPTHFLLGTEIEDPQQLEDVNFFVSDDPEAAEAVDLLLGTQGWRRFAQLTLADLRGSETQITNDGSADAATKLADLETQIERLERLTASTGGEAPILFDNQNEVERQYDAALAAYRSDQKARLANIGRASCFGGLVLLLVVMVLAVRRFSERPVLWLGAFGTATACVILGGFWMMQDSEDNVFKATVAHFDANDNDVRGWLPEVVLLDDVGAMNVEGDNEDWLEIERFQEDAAQPPFDFAAGDDASPDDDFGNEADEPNAPEAEEPLEEEKAGQRRDEKFQGGKIAELRRLNKRIGDREMQAGEGAGGPAGDHAGLFRRGYFSKYKRRWNNEIADLRRLAKQAAQQGKDQELVKLTKKLEFTLNRHRFPIRQYAHQHQPAQPGVRSDFTETVYWNPLLIADEEGRATIRFDLSDSVTTFRVVADAHGERGELGRIGTGGGAIESRIPFSIEPKLPLEVNAGDRIDLPVAVVNDTQSDLPVVLSLAHSDLFSYTGEAQRAITLAANERRREYFSFDVTGARGTADIELSGIAGPLGDAVRRSIEVVPPGFPASESLAGRLEGDQDITIELPDTWVDGSLTVNVQAYPTTLADLQSGIASILREPYGCFEQASTSNYPNVLVLDYMQQHKVADPAVTKRAKELLEKGYGKLTGYECKTEGYEWFGSDPGHEALTAYGLMQFRDMTSVYDVDPEMIERTATWLLARRDGEGRFQRNPKALDSFGGAPQDITDSYIVWALTESGQTGIDTEVELVVDLGRKSDDPYLVALAAASAINYGQQEVGSELLTRLKGLQQEDGHLLGTAGSITRSGGLSLKVETTALAALAWLKNDSFRAEANKAIDWIVGSRQGAGGFGSTQATILALKAMVAHALSNRGTVSGGDLIVLRRLDPPQEDDQDDAIESNNENQEQPKTEPAPPRLEEIARVSFTAGVQDAVMIEGLADLLEPGKNHLVLRLSGDNVMPYAVDVTYRTEKPVSDDACPLRLTTELASSEVKSGETVAMTATLTNATDKGQPMTIAILGLPGGLTVRADQLEELKEDGTIDYYETHAREVICYWRSLAPGRVVELKLDLVADIPGHYTAPASRAYLYYTAEQKQWTDPVAVEIAKASE